MKIYGITIIHPHSGELTRSEALTILKNEAKFILNGPKHIIDNMSAKEIIQEAAKRFNTLKIEDINYEMVGELFYNPEN